MEPDHGRILTRRRFFQAGMAAAAAGTIACRPERLPALGRAPVAIVRASSYSADLLDCLERGAALCGLAARGKRVLLKPNLVECERGAVIHTQAEVLAAASAPVLPSATPSISTVLSKVGSVLSVAAAS